MAKTRREHTLATSKASSAHPVVLEKLPEVGEPIAAAEEESSSSDEVDLKRIHPTSTRGVRGPGIRVTHWMTMVMAGAMAMSFLEFASVATSTKRKYSLCVQKFKDVVAPLDVTMATAAEIAMVMVYYFNDLYAIRVYVNKAEKTIVGWVYYIPSFSQFGSASVPRV